MPAWDGSKAICPLLEAYAAYACPADLKTWTCGWCRKMSQEKAAGVCTPLEYVTVVSLNALACTKEKLRTGQLHVVKLVHVLVWLEQSVPSAH